MTNYYYLVASLPSLDAADAPRLSTAEFRALCSEHMDRTDLIELDAMLSGAGGSVFARRWLDADTTIRNTVARLRAARSGVGVDPYLRSVTALDLTLEARTRDAMSPTDPGERERRLAALRRAVLRDLAFPTPFGPEAIFAYALELSLREHAEARSEDLGRARLGTWIDALIGPDRQRGGEES